MSVFRGGGGVGATSHATTSGDSPAAVGGAQRCTSVRRGSHARHAYVNNTHTLCTYRPRIIFPGNAGDCLTVPDILVLITTLKFNGLCKLAGFFTGLWGNSGAFGGRFLNPPTPVGHQACGVDLTPCTLCRGVPESPVAMFPSPGERVPEWLFGHESSPHASLQADILSQ